jgi:hypothetical protein
MFETNQLPALKLNETLDVLRGYGPEVFNGHTEFYRLSAQQRLAWSVERGAWSVERVFFFGVITSRRKWEDAKPGGECGGSLKWIALQSKSDKNGMHSTL